MSNSDPEKVLLQLEEETGTSYDREDRSITFTNPKNDTQHFVDTVSFLFEEGYVTKDDLPYVPGSGIKRYLLNTSGTHKDGKEMIRPREIAEGIYLETNHDSKSKKRHLRYLIEDIVLE
jgi:hypothetical protein